MSWQLFDRLAAFFKATNIYRSENLFQDQSSLARISAGGEFVNYSSHASLLEQTNLQINRLERYKDFDMEDNVGEITAALDMYADYASLIDPEYRHSIMIKAKSLRVKTELEDLFYNTLMIDNMLRPMIRYLCKYGDFPAEIVPTQNRNGIASLRHMNIYNFTRVETKYGDLVGFFYQDEMASQPTFLHPWQVLHLRLTSYESLYNPYGRCAGFGTKILTPNGYKNIENFKSGDDVYVYDRNNKLVVSKVVAACHSGEKDILEIKTRHYSNHCSPNHPVLVREWTKKPSKVGGRKWFADLVYKRADELKAGDELVIPRPLEKHDYQVLGDIKGNVIKADEQFAKLFGFLIGDGWIKRAYGNNKGVEFANGVDDIQNEYYKSLLAEYSPNKVVSYKKVGSLSVLTEDATHTYSKDFANFLESKCGFIQGSHNKRIPQWVFASPKSVQIAFIEGLVDANGSINTDRWNCDRYQIELSNHELIKDVKFLLHLIGWKCSHIQKRKRNGKVIFHSKEYERSGSWLLYFYKSDIFKSAGKHVQRNGCHGYDIRIEESKRFGTDTIFEPIISIANDGRANTADIQVAHEASNFIADGIVVHNSILDGTRKTFKQLRLMEDAALVYRLERASEKLIFKIPVGNIPPKEVPQYLQLIAREFKKRKIFDPASGDVSERYQPLIQNDYIFLPRRADGTGPEIDTLPGAENLDQIADIEYFKKKMVSALKIPFSRVGIGEPSDGDSEPLSKVAPEFAKSVQWIQREIAIGLKKVAITHLALRGFSADEIRSFDLFMTASSAIDELYRIETWASRADVIDSLKNTELFTDKWILEHFSTMTEDEIQQMRDEKEKQQEKETSPGGGGLPKLGGSLPKPGMPEMPDLIPGEGEGAELTDMPMPGETEGLDTAPLEPPLEGYNLDKEKQVLMEFHNQFKKRKVDYNSAFDYLMAVGEFDELPFSGDKLVKRVLKEEDVKSAIEDAKIIIKQESQPVILEDITVDDIPE